MRQNSTFNSLCSLVSICAGTLFLPACGDEIPSSAGAGGAGALGSGGTSPGAPPMTDGGGFNTAGSLATGGTTVGAGGAGGSVAGPPMPCLSKYEAETMKASTGEAVEGGWNIYTRGTLTATHLFKGGAAELTVHARGAVAGGVWPHMVVRVGGTVAGETDVTTGAWSAYQVSARVAAGNHPIEIEFTNDVMEGGADRNLYVDRVEVSESCTGSPAPGPGSGGSAGTQSGDATNPFSIPLFVEADSPAASAVSALRNSGNTADAELLNKIASSPQATWIGGWSGDPAGAVRGALDSASGQLRVLVAYNIYNRDCGNQSAGGVTDAPAYKAWIDGFANGIGERKVAVILEPDTLAHECDPTRWEVLSYAVTSLKKKPNAHVYIDAGHAGWVADGTMAGRLKTAGIANADGFSLNVASFQNTDASINYGTSISGQLGGKPFVIDTGRNGKGPAGGEWCNPAGRGLGERPTGNTGRPLVHAFLWIKRPGESDGTCNGGPAAGQWFQAYALELARNAVF